MLFICGVFLFANNIFSYIGYFSHPLKVQLGHHDAMPTQVVCPRRRADVYVRGAVMYSPPTGVSRGS